MLSVTIRWPGSGKDLPLVWRVLYLSGLAPSIRMAKNMVRSQQVWINTETLVDMTTTLHYGTPYYVTTPNVNGVGSSTKIITITQSTPYAKS